MSCGKEVVNQYTHDDEFDEIHLHIANCLVARLNRTYEHSLIDQYWLIVLCFLLITDHTTSAASLFEGLQFSTYATTCQTRTRNRAWSIYIIRWWYQICNTGHQRCKLKIHLTDHVCTPSYRSLGAIILINTRMNGESFHLFCSL